MQVETRPDIDDRYDDGQADYEDREAAEMNRLRGLVMVQASETEEVLGMILRQLDESSNLQRPAGALLKDIRKLLDADSECRWVHALGIVEQAIVRRNRVVHDRAHVGSVWRPYLAGGGEWVSVIGLLGDAEVSEVDLLDDLALQQEATEQAVRVLWYVGA